MKISLKVSLLLIILIIAILLAITKGSVDIPLAELLLKEKNLKVIRTA